MRDTTRNTKAVGPIACSLSGPELAERRRELAADVLGAALGVEELEDGYEFSFPGSSRWARKLVETIDAERACCPFFVFNLHFEPHGGRILLRVRGSEGTKEFIRTELLGPEKEWAGPDA